MKVVCHNDEVCNGDLIQPSSSSVLKPEDGLVLELASGEFVTFTQADLRVIETSRRAQVEAEKSLE